MAERVWPVLFSPNIARGGWLKPTGILGVRDSWKLAGSNLSYRFLAPWPLSMVEALERQNGKVLCQNHVAPRKTGEQERNRGKRFESET